MVGDFIEEMDLLFLEEQGGCDGVNRRVAPALVEEAAFAVQVCEEIDVGLGAEPREGADFEVRPLGLERLDLGQMLKGCAVRRVSCEVGLGFGNVVGVEGYRSLLTKWHPL